MSASGGGAGGYPAGTAKRVLDLSANVTADSRKGITAAAPFDGFVEAPFLSFPGNTNDTFGVQIIDEARDEVVLPFNDRGDAQDNFMYLDGVDSNFPVSFPVREGEEVRVEFLNLHQNQPRFMPVYVPVYADQLMDYKIEDAFVNKEERAKQRGG